MTADHKPRKSTAAKMFTKSWDRRFITAAAIIGGCGLFGNLLLLHAAWPARVRRIYTPNQPIQFSHKLHAGVMKIDCRYCHVGVDSAAHAAVPPISSCMNCHEHLVPAPRDESAAEKIRVENQIQKLQVLKDAWATSEPVRWNKVYDLADFVYFRHDLHTQAGLDCRTCHGAVETMEIVSKEAPLTMGWCLDCHMNNNYFVTPILDTHPSLKNLTGLQITDDPVYGDLLAPINCSTCHR